MPPICFYFQVHQPKRIRRFSIFDIARNIPYFNHKEEGSNLDNAWILRKVSAKCYVPTNRLLLKLIQKYPSFKVSFSLSGVFLEQLEENEPGVLKSFQDLVATGNVEILGETYYHSLSFLYSREEFREQVLLHKKKIFDLFGVVPKVFRNTELIFNNEVALEAEKLGFLGVIAEGADRILEWRSPNFVYAPQGTSNIKLLLKNYKLSDDIAFRFGSRDWSEFPLTSSTFASWVNAVGKDAHSVNLFMDYETFGEHQWEDTGIFSFLENLPKDVFSNGGSFVTPTEVSQAHVPVSSLDIPDYVSWADIERDLSAWRSNEMQFDALRTVYGLEKSVVTLADENLLHDWRLLQTSDHFYYMCTKWFADGDVHKYFNPYETPYDAYLAFMNAIKDMKVRVHAEHKKNEHKIPVRK